MPPSSKEPAKPAEPDPIESDGGVKWLLAAGLLRKLLSIAKSMVANELDIRDWMSGQPPPDFRTGREEVWFDYIADTGDDPMVMEKLAGWMARDYDADSLERECLEVGERIAEPHPALPRGAFLFVGGDTAYHVADETTLRHRFVEPFERASQGRVWADRPVYAIPGNHDYYDHLVGFNRLFRKPYPEKAKSVLPLPGYSVTQDASYVKILLPGEWELWGADIGPHGIDYRQWKYFRPGEALPPSRLVLCTPTPPIAHGKLDIDNQAELRAYAKLVFFEQPPPIADDTVKIDSVSDHTAPASVLEQVPKFCEDAPGVETPPQWACRLFLSGDTHHYARYSGGRSTASFATVVSGGGGAFMHPTEHVRGPIVPSKIYPHPTLSRVRTARALTSPRTIIAGGYVWLLGGVLGGLFFHTWPHETKALVAGAIWTLTLALGALAIGVGFWATTKAAKKRKSKAKSSRHDPAREPVREGLRWSNGFVPAGLFFALVLPFIAHHFFASVNPLSSASVWVTLAALVVVGLGALGGLAAGMPHPRAFALFGVAHGFIQVFAPALLARRGPLVCFGAAVCWVLTGIASRWLYASEKRWLLTALWLIQGAGLTAFLAFSRWPPPTIDLGQGTLLLAVAAGALITPMQFGIYVLVVSAWGGHANEAGIVARVIEYKEFIRFRVTPERLTGYVIGLDGPLADPHLVDVFVIEPSIPSPTGKLGNGVVKSITAE